MKNKKKVLLFSFVLVFLCVFTIGAVATADDVKLQESSSLLIEEYDIERFNGYVSTNEGLWGVFTGDTATNMFNALANILFTGTKIIFQVFDKAIELMYSMNILDKLGDIVSQLTNNLWDVFKSNYVSLVIVLAVLIVARTFFLENSKEAVKQLGKVVLVLVVAGVWFPRANQYLNQLNDYSFSLQADIMTTAGSMDSTKNIVGSGSGSANSASELATNTIRNELFIQTVYRPFLLQNYGTTDSNAIDDMYAKVDDENIAQDTGGDYLLSDEFANLSAKDKKRTIEKLTGTEENPVNYYMTADSVGYKIVISLIYFVGVFLYGVPLVAIAFLNVLLQLLALIYSYILPIIALLSLFPKYSNGLVNSIITIGKIFMGKAFLGLLVLLFSLVNVTMDLLIPQDGMVTALLNLFIKGVIYFLAIKYRKELISKVTMAMTAGSFSMRGSPNHHMNDFGDQRRGFETGAYVNRSQYSNTNTMDDFVNEQPYQASGSQQESGTASADIRDPQTEANSDDLEKMQVVNVSGPFDVEKPELKTEDSKLRNADGVEVKDPQLQGNENIGVGDSQVSVEEEIGIEDPQLEVPEEIGVDDPQVTLPEELNVRDPQVDVPDELRIQDPQSAFSNQLKESPSASGQTNTETRDIENQGRVVARSFHRVQDENHTGYGADEQASFRNRLKNLRG